MNQKVLSDDKFRCPLLGEGQKAAVTLPRNWEVQKYCQTWKKILNL
jgi:hypothetical protein